MPRYATAIPRWTVAVRRTCPSRSPSGSPSLRCRNRLARRPRATKRDACLSSRRARRVLLPAARRSRRTPAVPRGRRECVTSCRRCDTADHGQFTARQRPHTRHRRSSTNRRSTITIRARRSTSGSRSLTAYRRSPTPGMMILTPPAAVCTRCARKLHPPCSRSLLREVSFQLS